MCVYLRQKSKKRTLDPDPHRFHPDPDPGAQENALLPLQSCLHVEGRWEYKYLNQK